VPCDVPRPLHQGERLRPNQGPADDHVELHRAAPQTRARLLFGEDGGGGPPDEVHDSFLRERPAPGQRCNPGLKASLSSVNRERAHYGQPILKPVYDHRTGSLVRPEYLQPREFVIVEGLLGFHTPAMRQFYDVKVFLDPPEDLRRTWKINRDTTKRGYTVEQVLKELEKRESDSASFIRPQREYADIVVRFYPPPVESPDQTDSHLNVQLVLRPTIPHPDLSYLFDDDPNRAGVRLELGRDDGRPVDFLKVDGNVSRV